MNVAFIPVRGGSKSIPLKNIRLINNKPLVYWVMKAANNCDYIDKIYVATDSDKIRETVENICFSKDESFKKVCVIGRSKESATDVASTESAMLEFAERYEFDNIVLIQATSPLLTSEDLNNGFKEFFKENTDSVLSVVRQKRFYWEVDDRGFAYATNYNVFQRPRRQEFKGTMVENGAFYISSKKSLIESKNRISGSIRTVEMCEETFLEIDEPNDWTIIEGLLRKREQDASAKKKSRIRMFLTDCDGCLTDGGMYYSEKGDELKKFNTRDGMAFSMLREKGILTGIITGEDVELVRRRAEKLMLDIYEPGCKDKEDVIKTLCQKYNIDLSQVVYIGDDINDLESLKMVGYGWVPADAIKRVQENARYIAKSKGGEGVIREVAEWVLSKIETDE